MIRLDDWTKITILKAFEESAETARKELNKKVHVMEITNAILKRNAPQANITIAKVNKAFLKSNPGATLYKGQSPVRKLYYLKSPGKLLLIAPSFASIQTAIRNISQELQIETLDVGHTAGFGKEERNTVLGYRIKQALLEPGSLSQQDVDTLYSKYDRELGRIHMDYRVNFAKSNSLASNLVGKLDFIYTVPQDSYLNRIVLGSKEASLARAFKKYLTGNIEKLLDVRTSPSIMEMMFMQLKETFLTGEWKKVQTKATKKGSFDKPNKAKVTKVAVTSGKGEDSDLNTIKLQTLINLRLHDQIRINMGKGRSRNVLNYRTGRFAKSAEAQAVFQSRQDALDVYYTYQRFPYDTFLPGGRLYKPGRDPRKIIGKSIRQLTREYVSNNFKVNPILRDKV